MQVRRAKHPGAARRRGGGAKGGNGRRPSAAPNEITGTSLLLPPLAPVSKATTSATHRGWRRHTVAEAQSRFTVREVGVVWRGCWGGLGQRVRERGWAAGGGWRPTGGAWRAARQFTACSSLCQSSRGPAELLAIARACHHVVQLQSGAAGSTFNSQPPHSGRPCRPAPGQVEMEIMARGSSTGRR